jgi:hypothetical protein
MCGDRSGFPSGWIDTFINGKNDVTIPQCEAQDPDGIQERTVQAEELQIYTHSASDRGSANLPRNKHEALFTCWIANKKGRSALTVRGTGSTARMVELYHRFSTSVRYGAGLWVEAGCGSNVPEVFNLRPPHSCNPKSHRKALICTEGGGIWWAPSKAMTEMVAFLRPRT